MFPAVSFSIEHDRTEQENEPDAVVLTFNDPNGESIKVRLSGFIRYPSEHGPPFDDEVSLAEDFLAELASMLGYQVVE